jgi:PhnB protein
MKPPIVQAYLMLGGRCEEALNFYRTAVGAKVEMMMRFSESPMPVPADKIPPGFQNKVMHSSFSIGETTLMASDGCEVNTPFKGFSLALYVATEAEADRVFNALADGGKVNMPLGKTFWSPRYGMLTDRFGIDWMVMVSAPPPK